MILDPPSPFIDCIVLHEVMAQLPTPEQWVVWCLMCFALVTLPQLVFSRRRPHSVRPQMPTCGGTAKGRTDSIAAVEVLANERGGNEEKQEAREQGNQQERQAEAPR